MTSVGSRSTSRQSDGIWKAHSLGVGTWLVQGDGCTSYLVVGDERAVLVDTGFATQNIRAHVQTLTDIPVVWAANTHGHFDHTGGNGWFDLVYMSAEAARIATIPYPSKAALTYPFDYPVKVVSGGDVIDLGGRTLEVIEIPAHAPSSVAFLDRRQRLLFSGDEVAPFVMLYWQQDEPQPSIEQYASNLDKLLARRSEFDRVAWGHAEGLLDASLVEDLRENAGRILSGIEGEQMTLPEDSPEDFVMFGIENMRVSEYRDSHIGYDVRYVFDRRSASPDARG